MNFGGFNAGVYGSDQMTVGLSPTTMHVDPVSGLPEAQAVAPGTTVVVAPTPASGGVPWMLLLVLAGVAWYGYKQGWFAGLFESEPETSMVIERRA